jgi:hypothetical protein
MNQDVFLASLLGRLVELEAQDVVSRVRNKPNLIQRFKKRFFK